MISNERMDEAVRYLVEHDAIAAELKVEVERMDYRRKKIRAAHIQHGDGAMELRKAVAENSADYDKATTEWLEALAKSEAMQNKRKTEALVVDVWRSMNANRRQGNV